MAVLSPYRSSVTAGSDDLRSAYALTTFAGLALCFVAPLLLIQATPTPASDQWLWAWSVCAFAGAQYAALLISGRPRLYELSFWLFSYVFLGLAPLVQLRRQIDPSTTSALRHEFDGVAFAIVWVGMIAFSLGASFQRERSAPTAPVLVSLAALLQVRRQRSVAQRFGINLLIVFTAATLALTANLISSRRFLMGTVILAVAAMLGAFATPRRFRIAATAIREQLSARIRAGPPVQLARDGAGFRRT